MIATVCPQLPQGWVSGDTMAYAIIAAVLLGLIMGFAIAAASMSK